jgi:short-subunit dehydrogenase
MVAGAAEGLGQAWSNSLASRGINLVMVDNQEEKLTNLAHRLTEEKKIKTRTVIADLDLTDSIASLVRELDSVDCRLLIYNAAYSRVKPFLTSTSEELDRYISVNCRTQLLLIHAFAKHLVDQKKKGGILLMSSLAGLIGMQRVAPYAATKAFTWNLAEALSYDLEDNGIDVMACIAGATSTPAYLATQPRYGVFRPSVLSPEYVTEAALKRFGKTKRFIPGFSNRMNYFILTRLMPRSWASRLANKTMEKMYPVE